MKPEVKKRANNTLIKTAAWIEDQNTSGAGKRLLQATISEISKIAASKASLAFCKDTKLTKFKYRCFTYRDKWVVAYKIERNKFVVYRFIYGPWLDY